MGLGEAFGMGRLAEGASRITRAELPRGGMWKGTGRCSLVEKATHTTCLGLSVLRVGGAEAPRRQRRHLAAWSEKASQRS